MAKVAGDGSRCTRLAHECERDGGEEGAGARMAEEGDAASGAISGTRREEGRGGGGGSRAYWVDGCWYGFQEEREGEG